MKKVFRNLKNGKEGLTEVHGIKNKKDKKSGYKMAKMKCSSIITFCKLSLKSIKDSNC